jgi:hypothetical protein
VAMGLAGVGACCAVSMRKLVAAGRASASTLRRKVRARIRESHAAALRNSAFTLAVLSQPWRMLLLNIHDEKVASHYQASGIVGLILKMASDVRLLFTCNGPGT